MINNVVDNYNYYHEIQDILKQFVSAFDNTIIKRFNKNRQPQDIVKVRYLNAPKGRVLHDIISQEPHELILPAVAFTVTNISRDESRVFNKLSGYYPLKSNTRKDTQKVPQPIPINIDVSMSIIAKFELDLYQIIGNFLVYSNPYIILTWKLPQEAGLEYDEELRTEVLWNGQIPVEQPTDLGASDRYKITADTSFTIKTWLFRDLGEDSSSIYFIDVDFNEVSSISDSLFNYSSASLLSGGPYYGDTPGVSLSGFPQITNVYYSKQGISYEVFETQNISLSTNNNLVLLYGKNFDIATTIALSSNNLSAFTSTQQLTSEYGRTITVFPLSSFTILSDNVMTIELPHTLKRGLYDIFVHNFVGWQSIGVHKGIYFDTTITIPPSADTIITYLSPDSLLYYVSTDSSVYYTFPA